MTKKEFRGIMKIV